MKMTMMLVVELVLVAVAATGALAYDNLGGFNALGAGAGVGVGVGCAYPGIDPLGGFGAAAGIGLGVAGIHHGISSAGSEEPEQVLTCQDSGKGVAFVINIGKRQPKRRKHGFAASPFLGASSLLLPHSPLGVGFGNPFHPVGGVGGGGRLGLNASIDVQYSRGESAEVGVLVVETGFTSGFACKPEEFTAGVSPASRESNSLFGGHLGAQLSSFGAYGLGHQVGFGSPLGAFGFPQHIGFASKGGGYGNRPETLSADGLLTVLDLESTKSVQSTSVFLEKLDGYKKLKELAGRPVLLCKKTEVDGKGKAVCDGEVMGCCTLGYDFVARELNTGY